MLTYLLEKFEKIKKDRALYCSQIEETRKKEETRIEETRKKEETGIEETRKKESRVPTMYDFICKNTRKN